MYSVSVSNLPNNNPDLHLCRAILGAASTMSGDLIDFNVCRPDGKFSGRIYGTFQTEEAVKRVHDMYDGAWMGGRFLQVQDAKPNEKFQKEFKLPELCENNRVCYFTVTDNRYEVTDLGGQKSTLVRRHINQECGTVVSFRGQPGDANYLVGVDIKVSEREVESSGNEEPALVWVRHEALFIPGFILRNDERRQSYRSRSDRGGYHRAA